MVLIANVNRDILLNVLDDNEEPTDVHVLTEGTEVFVVAMIENDTYESITGYVVTYVQGENGWDSTTLDASLLEFQDPENENIDNLPSFTL